MNLAPIPDYWTACYGSVIIPIIPIFSSYGLLIWIIHFYGHQMRFLFGHSIVCIISYLNLINAKFCIIYDKSKCFSNPAQRSTLVVNCLFLLIALTGIYLAIVLDNCGSIYQPRFLWNFGLFYFIGGTLLDTVV